MPLRKGKHGDYAPFGDGLPPPSSAAAAGSASPAASPPPRPAPPSAGAGAGAGGGGVAASTSPSPTRRRQQQQQQHAGTAAAVATVDGAEGGGDGEGGGGGSIALGMPPPPPLPLGGSMRSGGGGGGGGGGSGRTMWPPLPPSAAALGAGRGHHDSGRWRSLCLFRMSPVQALFLAAFLTCLCYFSIDAWTRRRVLEVLFLTLNDVRPHTPLLVTVALVGMGLVFSTLGFPTTLLAVLGGYVYGDVLGGYLAVLISSIVVTVTASLGCLCSFLITRGMLRDCASEWLHSRAAWEGLDTALREQGLKVNLLLRLSPIVPNNLVNVGMGLTATRLEDYCIGCFVGMLPTVILLSYFGSGLHQLEEIGEFASRHRTEMSIIYATGAVLLLAVVLLLRRATKRAMAEAARRKQSLVDSIGWDM